MGLCLLMLFRRLLPVLRRLLLVLDLVSLFVLLFFSHFRQTLVLQRRLRGFLLLGHLFRLLIWLVRLNSLCPFLYGGAWLLLLQIVVSLRGHRRRRRVPVILAI